LEIFSEKGRPLSGARCFDFAAGFRTTGGNDKPALGLPKIQVNSLQGMNEICAFGYPPTSLRHATTALYNARAAGPCCRPGVGNVATIAVTSHLRNVGPSEPLARAGNTVGELIASLEPDYPLLRNYIFDDQGRVRQHIAIFVDGALRPRSSVLAEQVAHDTEVYVLQALSGG
jgi:molybdopterin synthase sulfur carrier subunit